MREKIRPLKYHSNLTIETTRIGRLSANLRDANPHLPIIEGAQPTNDTEERRLSSTGDATESQHFALSQSQRNTMQDLPRPELLADSVKLQHIRERCRPIMTDSGQSDVSGIFFK
jgi:hypothetical protein